jgi:hypothetical protein
MLISDKEDFKPKISQRRLKIKKGQFILIKGAIC